MKSYDVLIVEDDQDLCQALCDTLEIAGYQVNSAANGTEALLKLSKSRFKLVVSDVQMPVMDGFQLLQNIQGKYPDTPVLMMTAYGSIPKAVAAIQAGAVDYLVKPFEARNLVDKVAEVVLETAGAAEQPLLQDPGMKRLYTLLEKVAKTNVTVLLQGESGTGKEVLAQYIHRHSGCHQGPFVAVNCAAIPENMLEAMLFGYEKGAFTGAIQAMAGKFEQAQGGTLLLDEISEMDLSLQAKLLRVLQEKEVERLGSAQKIALTVRILTTTNRKLKERVAQGLFREDLYYRLNVFPVHIPALRERPADILPLSMDLMQRHQGADESLPRLTPAAQQKLLAYHWPGNVRELDNVLQRALIFHQSGEIATGDLVFEEDLQQPPDTACQTNLPTEITSLDDGVRSAEEKIILQTLHEVQGSRKITAEKLGISPRTLRYKIARMKEIGIAVPC